VLQSFDLTDNLTITGNLLRAKDTLSLADDVDREERATARQLDSARSGTSQKSATRKTWACSCSIGAIICRRSLRLASIGDSRGS